MSKLLLFSAALAVTSAAAAQWNPDATVNNRITNVLATKADLNAIPDGSGGMYITWTDSRNSATTGTDIYFQHILNNGTLAYDSAGILVCNAAGSQSVPSIVAGISGAVIIAWQDARTSATTSNDVYAQKINANGSVAWTENGVAISTAAANQNGPVMAADGAGGAVMVFQDTRTTATTGIDLYAQRVDANGNVQWASDGVVIVNQANGQNQQVILPDGSGNYYLVWNDSRSGTSNSGIYAQKINNAGEPQWETANQGVAVCTAANNQLNPQIALGNGGNLFITWADLRAGLSNATDIYAHLLNSNGVKQFTDADGLLVCNAANNQTNPYITADGNGNAIVIWVDQRAGTSSTLRDIFAQKINANGTVAWAPNGVAVVSNDGFTQPNSTSAGLSIISDGSGGAIVTWDDARDGTSNLHVFAQRLDTDGNQVWPLGETTKTPIPVANGTANQRIPVMVSDNNAGAIVAFADSRNGTNFDIFASRLFSNGTLPVNSITLTGVQKNMQSWLTWKTQGEKDVQRYEVQRSNGNGAWATIASTSALSGSSNQYTHVDSKPFSGNNFYRIKIIDRDGSINNSATVRVAIPVQSGKVSVSPVPASNRILVSLQEPAVGNYQLKLVDGNGRIALQQSVFVSNTTQQLQVPVQIQALAAGMYRLVVSSQDGTIVASVPVQKQ